MPSRLTVICDFDGTVTTEDVGHSLCSRFAPGALDRVDGQWMRGEISFAEAFRLACLELKAPHEEMVSHALEVGRLRPGFVELVDACAQRGVEMVIASAGIDLYVEPIVRRGLGARREGVELCVNSGSVTPGGVSVAFPHQHADCAECGNCKGLRARKARAAGRRVVGVGDSFTDKCLAREADHVFARSWLKDHCVREGIAHEPFEDFEPVRRLVEKLAS